jgi:hypothetical protein
MSLRMRIGLAVLWVVSVTAVGLYGQGRESAVQVNPTIVSGGDIGFRIDRRDANAVTGRLMVRVNGQWVETREAAAGGGIRPLTMR